MRILLVLLCLFTVTAHAGSAVLPVTKAQVCTPGYSAGVRSVTAAVKRQVFERAHVAWGTKGYVVDHRTPLSLGGSNDISNLQLQTLADSKAKDRVEDYLHRQVCSGQLTLRAAQRLIVRWKEVKAGGV